MRFLTFSLLLLIFGFSIRAYAQEKHQIKEKLSPPTPVELTQEEKDWWKAVEAATTEATTAAREVETLIANFKEKKPDSVRSEAISKIPQEALRNLKEAKERYYFLLAQGVEKKFRTSVESSRPKALAIPSPGYSKEGRTSRVCGTVTVRTEIAANGVPVSANVLKSIQKRCPTISEVANGKSPQDPISENPPSLGQGLENVAIETALEILFFPAIENHHLVKSKAKIEINFNIY